LVSEETPEWTEFAENDFVRPLSGHAETIFGAAKQDNLSYLGKKVQLVKECAESAIGAVKTHLSPDVNSEENALLSMRSNRGGKCS
ncbi:MAG TPA: hypothetical protein VGO47_06770, partial [Chlamydiales bacterium]|nr:hypothetical protein [Chlamydiales bacterium]